MKKIYEVDRIVKVKLEELEMREKSKRF